MSYVRPFFIKMKPARGIDKTSVDANQCLEGVCSGAVFFEDVPPACPLSRMSVKKTGAVREL